MKHSIVFAGDTTRQFMTNYRRDTTFHATIQNNTDQSITITVSNLSSNRGETPIYDTPAGGALTIASGAMGQCTEPYAEWLLTAAAAATGTVDIVEAG